MSHICTRQTGTNCLQCFRTEHFQVHSTTQLNTEVSIKTKGNNHFNFFYQTPHQALVPNPQQTSLFFVLLRGFSHVQKNVVCKMINDCYCIRRLLFTQHLMETVKEGKRGSLMSSFFSRFGEKAEQSQVASAKDALQPQVLSSVPTFLIQEESSVLLSSLAKMTV